MSAKPAAKCMVCKEGTATYCLACYEGQECDRQHCDEEWLDETMERSYRAGWERAVRTLGRGDTAALLAQGPSELDEQLDLEKVEL